MTRCQKDGTDSKGQEFLRGQKIALGFVCYVNNSKTSAKEKVTKKETVISQKCSCFFLFVKDSKTFAPAWIGVVFALEKLSVRRNYK